MSYYNTTNLKGETLNKAWSNASKQDDKVAGAIAYLCKNGRGDKLTCRRVWWAHQKLYGPVQLTSVRRSVDTLIKKGYLKHVLDIKGDPIRIRHICPVEGFKTSERQIIKIK